MVIERGEIRWATLPGPRRSNPAKPRPVLVVQADAFNRSRIATVVVAVLTSNLDRARAPGTVRIPKRSSGLDRASVVNLSQLATVDRSFLGERVGSLPAKTMDEVDRALALVLDLG